MPYINYLKPNVDTQRNPSFVVFRKGKVIATGTADELYKLFNMRPRQLRLHLLELCRGDDEDQLDNHYQVMRLREWEQLKEDAVAYCDAVLIETERTFVLPADLDEEELLYNPNNLGLQLKVKRKTNPYYRWRRKHLVERWVAEAAFPAPTELVLSDGEEQTTHQVTTEAQMKQVLREHEMTKAAKEAKPRKNKWDTRKTQPELDRQSELLGKRSKSIWL